MKLSKIKPNPDNPRILKDDKFRKLVKSIQDFPEMMEKRPIVVDENNVVLGGNMRLRALQEIYGKNGEVPDNWVTTAKGWSKEKKKEFVIKDNSSFGEWDWDMLANEWDAADLSDWGVDFPQDWAGGTPTEEEKEAVEDDFDETRDEVPTICKDGDIWQLGEHRLMCGDSTDAGSVALLMNGERADLVFTDPPYGVAYKVKASASDGNTISEARKQGCKNETIANDATLEQAYEIARKAMANCIDVPIKYVCCDWKSYPTMKKAVEDAGIVQKALIVWDKGGPYQHLDLFAKRHEFIIYAGEYGGKKTVDTDIWSFPREFRADHPTPKSIKLIAHAICCHDNINIVLDVFGGSGSTLIACEQLNRKCRMMELDPHYCTVIIARWEKLTGLKAERL